MRRKLLLLSLFFSALSSIAQDEGNGWQPVKTATGVAVYYKQITCNGSDAILIKLVNNNKQAVKADLGLWNGAASKAVHLGPHQTKEGACDSTPAFMLVEKIPSGASAANLKASLTIQLL